MRLIRAYVSLYVHTHFIPPFVALDLIKSDSYRRYKTLIIVLLTVSQQGTECFLRNIKTESRNSGEMFRNTEKIKVWDISLTFSPLYFSLSLSLYLYLSCTHSLSLHSLSISHLSPSLTLLLTKKKKGPPVSTLNMRRQGAHRDGQSCGR